MATDREILTRVIVDGSSEYAVDPMAGGQPANTSTGVAHDINRRSYTIIKPVADPAAADATTNGVCNGTYWFQTVVPRKSRLVGAKLDPMVALTGHNTTYATINVTKDNGAGGSITAILSAPTKLGTAGTGSWAVATLINLTPWIVTTSDAHVCAAGSSIKIQVAKASTGVVVQPCTITLDFEEC